MARHRVPESTCPVSCWQGSYNSDSIISFKGFSLLGLNSLRLMPLTCQGFSDFGVCEDHQEGLLKHSSLGLIPRSSVLVSLGWGLRIGISSKIMGGAKAVGPRLYFENH